MMCYNPSPLTNEQVTRWTTDSRNWLWVGVWCRVQAWQAAASQATWLRKFLNPYSLCTSFWFSCKLCLWFFFAHVFMFPCLLLLNFSNLVVLWTMTSVCALYSSAHYGACDRYNLFLCVICFTSRMLSLNEGATLWFLRATQWTPKLWRAIVVWYFWSIHIF
jgi:hypothetical protein